MLLFRHLDTFCGDVLDWTQAFPYTLGKVLYHWATPPKPVTSSFSSLIFWYSVVVLEISVSDYGILHHWVVYSVVI